MKKRLLVVIPVALLMVGCGKKKDRTTENVTTKAITTRSTPKTTTEVKSYNVSVEYYFQNLEDNDYTINSSLTKTISAKEGSTVKPEIKVFDGFECKNSDVSIVVTNKEANNVIKVYFDRKICNISYKTNIEGISFDPVKVKYGSKLTEQVLDIPGYSISSYKVDGIDFDFNTVITSSFEMECVVTPNTDTAYTIRYLLDKIDSDQYEIYREEPKTGTTDTTIDLTGLDIDIEEGTFKEFDKDSYTINGDGSTIVNLYYKRHSYDITFDTHGGPELSPIKAKYGSVIEEPNISRVGYTNTGWKVNGTTYTFTSKIYSGFKLECFWTPNTDTAYTVNYYLQNIDNNEYSIYDTVLKSGTSDSTIESLSLRIQITEGYFKDFGETDFVIKPDGSTVIDVYYDRHLYGIQFITNNDIVIDSISVRHGAKITEPQLTKEGYDISEWTINNSTRFDFRTDTITGNAILECNWVPRTNTLYKVNYYLDSTDSEDWVLYESENHYGTTDTFVYAEDFKKEIEHATYSSYGEYSYKISGSGSTEVNLFYIRDTYKVTVKSSDSFIELSDEYDNKDLKYGRKLNIEATFNSTLGYAYDGVYVNGSKVSSDLTYSFTVTSDITVEFKAKVIDELKNFTFTSDGENCVITGIIENEENVVIPSIATEIANSAFSNNTTIKTLVIGKNVKKINYGAFNGCTNLTSVTFANNSNLTEIGNAAFLNTKLSSITLPDKLEVIGSYAFREALNGVDLFIPSSVTTIGESAFYMCKLNSISFDSNTLIEEIGDEAFNNCTISSITIPKSVKVIGEKAFNLSYIKDLTFEEGTVLEEIKDSAFMNCNLRTLDLPDTLNAIGESAFSYNSNLVLVKVNSDVTIGDQAFNFSNVKVIINNSNLEFTKGEMYEYGGIAYYAVLILSPIDVSNLLFEDDFIYNVTDTDKELLFYYGSNNNIVIKDDVTIIKDGSFTGNKLINRVIIPNSVITIGFDSFRNCSNLYSVSIGSGVTEIGNTAFYYCDKLFEVNNLSSLNIVKGSTNNGYVAQYAIFLTNESNFTSKIDVIDDTFVVYNSTTDVTLVKILNVTNNIVIPSNVTIIGDQVLNTSSSVFKKITIGKNVKSIGTKAFYNCTYLSEVVIEDDSALESIGSYAFSYTRIASIDLPEGVTTIGDYAFYYCSYLTEVNVLGDSINTIGKYAFANCGLLHIFHVTENVSLIDTNAFDSTFIYSIFNESQLDIVMGTETHGKIALYACEVYSNIEDKTLETVDGFTTIVKKNELGESIDKYLLAYDGEEENIVIPNDITIIEKNVFKNYANSFSVTFEENSILKEIKEGAFYNTKLQSIEIPSSIEKLGNNALICNNLTLYDNCYYAGNSENPYVVLYELLDKSVTSFEINNKCRIICGNALLSSNIENLVIPDSVVFIGEQGLFGCKASSITLSKNLKSLEDGVFRSCSNLTTIVIPSSVEFIEGNAFESCSNLEYVYFEGNSKLKVIGKNETRGMFYQCNKLKDVVLPYGLEEINVNILMLSSVTNLVIPGSVRRINTELKYTEATNIYFNGTAGDLCMIDYKNVESVFMRKCSYFYILDEDGSISFNGNNYGLLTEAVIPLDVTEIKKFAFHSAYNLYSLKIHSGVTRIDDSAFYDTCLAEVYNESNLEISTSSLNFSTVKVVHQNYSDESNLIITDDGFVFIKYNNTYAFVRYIGPSKSNYIMPESFMDGDVLVTSYVMAKYSLGHITDLTGIVINNSISSVERNVAYGSSKFKNVYYDGNQEAWQEVKTRFSWLTGTVYFYSEDAPTDEGNYWCYYNGEPTAWSVIPKYSLTTTINDSSMGSIDVYDNEEIYGGTTITLTATPNTTYEFKGWYVNDEFVWASTTYEFVINSNLEIEARFSIRKADSLDEYVISDGVITGLVNSDSIELVIPSSVNTIGESAFEGNTYIQTVVIPPSITTISNKAFKDCTNLTNVYFDGTIDEWARINISSAVSSPCYNSGNLYVLDESGSITHNGKHYSLLVDLVIPDNVITIGNCAFTYLTCIENIIIPDSVTSVGIRAFNNCSNVKTLVVGKNISTIGTDAFRFMTGLEKIFYHSSYDEAPNVLPSSSVPKYYYSETQPTDTTHNYWHYVNGVPTSW